jgi:cell division protein FtsB
MTYQHSFLSAKKIGIAFIVLVLSYFIYHIYHGERGLIAQETLQSEYTELQKTYHTLHQQRLRLENKINSLGAGDGQIDPDLLVEHAKKLGYIAPDEIMITE